MKSSLKKISQFYERALFNTVEGKEGLNYLYDRGFTDQTIQDFGVGWCPSFPVDYIKHKLLTYTDLDRLVELEHLYKNGQKYSDKFNGRITFPVKDSQGSVVGFAARCLDDRMKYVNSTESEFYHKGTELFGLNLAKEALWDADKAVLCEGYTDAMAFHQVGIKNAVACGGTYATDKQILSISRFTGNIVLAFDNDGAGDEATSRTIDLVKKMGLGLELLNLPKGQDPADALLSENAII